VTTTDGFRIDEGELARLRADISDRAQRLDAMLVLYRTVMSNVAADGVQDSRISPKLAQLGSQATDMQAMISTAINNLLEELTKLSSDASAADDFAG
jgi:hypothetical protein